MKNKTISWEDFELAFAELESYPVEKQKEIVNKLLQKVQAQLPDGAIDQNDNQQMLMYLLSLKLNTLKFKLEH